MAIDPESLFRRFLRFLLSGGILILIDYSVFFILDEGLGVAIGLSQGAARLAGAVAGFILQRSYVFRARSKDAGQGIRQGVLYSILTLANIVLSALCADFLGNSVGVRPVLAVKLMTDALLAGETFVLLHLVFKERKD